MNRSQKTARVIANLVSSERDHTVLCLRNAVLP